MQVLIEIQPLNLSTGAREAVRVASAQDRRITGLNGAVWVPALLQPPTLTIRLFDGDFSSAIDPGSATFTIALDEVGRTYPNAYAYLWAGAPVSIYAENAGVAWPWTRRFVGKVSRFEKAAKRIQLVAEVDTAALEKDVLYLKYAGTTGIEGGADLKDRVRPWVWGHVKGIEPVQIDIDNSVFQVSGYGAIGGISALFERGVSFGASMGNYADYAALVAATIPPGRWATCLAQGLFRLGAPPYGVITADVQGHKVSGSVPRRTGAIIKAMAAALGISSDSIDSASLDALDVAVPRNVNVYLTEQETFIELAQRLCLPCNAYSGMSWEGKFFAVRPVFGSSVMTLHGQGRADPQVLEMIEGGVNPPFKKTIFGADRCWRVHTTTEIAYQDILVDRGRYQAGETYRAGNIVDLADGSRWIYTADTATQGNAPVEGSAFWTRISDQIEPVYLDGTPIEDLKPAEPRATEGAPPGTPVGDSEAQAVVDAIVTNALTIAEEALRQGTYRAEIDEIIQISPSVTLRQVVEQIGVMVDGQQSFINFLRQIDTEGNGKVVLSINSGGAITGTVNTLTEGIGQFLIVADILKAVDPNGGAPLSILSYGLDNRLYLGDVVVDTLEAGSVKTESIEIGAVKTSSIDLNQVTEGPEWQADFAGATGDTLGASTTGVWAEFGYSGAKCSMSFTGLPAGTMVQVDMHFNAQRTGSDNDRVNFRLKRIGPGGATTYHPTIYRAGAANYPQVLAWMWRDSISTTGDYEYRIEYQRVTDRMSYYECHAIATAGKR